MSISAACTVAVDSGSAVNATGTITANPGSTLTFALTTKAGVKNWYVRVISSDYAGFQSSKPVLGTASPSSSLSMTCPPSGCSMLFSSSVDDGSGSFPSVVTFTVTVSSSNQVSTSVTGTGDWHTTSGVLDASASLGAANTVRSVKSDASDEQWALVVDANVDEAAAITGSKVASSTTSALGVVKLANNLGGTALLPAVLSVDGTGGTCTITCNNFSWGTSLSTPLITQADNTTASATASTLALQAQNATGTTANGGALAFRGGTGTTAGGAITFNTAATTSLAEAGRVTAAGNWQIGTNSNQPTGAKLNFANNNGTLIGFGRNASSSLGMEFGISSGNTTFLQSDVGSMQLLAGAVGGSGTLYMGAGSGVQITTYNGGTTVWSFTSVTGGAQSCTVQSAATSVAYTQTASSTTNGATTTVSSQNSTLTNGSGGALVLQGGAKNGTGLRGPVQIQTNGTTEVMIEATEVVSGNRVVSLAKTTALTSTQMPANTGDGVVFVANAQTAPTANSVGGGILYSTGGAGTWRGTSGTVSTFGPAEPHCPRCGSDFAIAAFENPKYGKTAACFKCMLGALVKLGINPDDFMIFNEGPTES